MNKIKIKGVNEEIVHDILPNGLEVFLLPNKNVKNFYMTLNTKYGSMITDFKRSDNKKTYRIPHGVAHFLEHLTFYMEDMDASDYFASIGSSSNAYTSLKVTCYEVFGYSKFKENLNYLLDFVFSPFYNQKQVKDEKGIIIEEVKMYEDLPESKEFFNLLENMFYVDEIKSRVAGTVEDVKSITLDDITNAYNAFYHPSNMFLIITGNFNAEEALSIILENQAKKEFCAKFKIDIKNNHEKPGIIKEKETIYTSIEIDKVSIGLKVPLSSFEKLKLKKEELYVYVSLIINSIFGRSSILKERLTSGNIITDGISTDIIYTDEYILINIISETPYPERYSSIIKEELKNMSIDEEEIKRKSRVAISNLIMSFDDIEATNANIQTDIIEFGKIIPNYFDIYNNIKLLTANKIAKIISNSPSSFLILSKKNAEK